MFSIRGSMEAIVKIPNEYRISCDSVGASAAWRCGAPASPLASAAKQVVTDLLEVTGQ
jgi:hypothetical protein